jgi:hypothetical protein
MANLSNAFGGQAFDANNVEPSQPRELLPPGKYVAQIIDSEMKPTTTGGEKLALTFEILDGPHAKRRVWTNLNLVNANTTAMEIAQRDLSAICRAVGRLQVSDSEQLHSQPLTINVEVKRAKGEYKAANEVRGYAPASGAAPAPAPRTAAPAATPAAAARTTAAPPWRRSA